MSIVLFRVDKAHYRVMVGGAQYGELVFSSWDGRWIAYDRNGIAVADRYTRDEAASALLEGR